ncbi:hypothetical protein [Gordonia phthalatica]|uniref:hypothetical protein n=1 Tax=Gordonia phthalatica TaxID=1136941 RepID=UPI0012FF23F3|nr:hypothetical protein [Gordonia phthalatica]
MTTDNQLDPTIDDLDPETSVVVTLGSPLGGRIRTWNDDVAQTWIVEDVEHLERLWATGAIGTASLQQAGHHRDVGVLDTANHILCVTTTTPISKFGGLIEGHEHFALKPAPSTKLTKNARKQRWEAFEDFLVTATSHAFDRGETLVIGGPDPDGPSVTIGQMYRSSRRIWAISAAPAPFAELWPVPRPDERDRVTTLAKFNPMLALHTAMRTTDALRSWGVDPYDATITYVQPIEMITGRLSAHSLLDDPVEA